MNNGLMTHARPSVSLLGDAIAGEGQDCLAVGRIRNLDELIEELEHLLANVGLSGGRKLGTRVRLRIGQCRRVSWADTEVSEEPGDVDAKMAGDASEQGWRRALFAGLEARQERGR